MRTVLGPCVVAVLCAAGSAGRLAPAPRPSAKAGPVRGLRPTDRWARLAEPVAFTADGVHWIGGVDHDLVVYDGARELGRYPLMVGERDALVSLPHGGWIAGPRLLDAEGHVRFDGYGWAQRFGRFGSPKAAAFSPDGTVAILYGADSPSRCLCDRARGTGGSSAGALVRLTFDGARPDERVLVEHTQGEEYAVAASRTAVAATAGGQLSVWPATGTDAPATVHLAGPPLTRLTWASDRYLVGTRLVDLDRTDVVVLDRDKGWRPAWTWPVPGTMRALQVRPGGAELAVAWTNYRATDRVLRDDREVAVFALAGARHAVAHTKGYPMSIAWSPSGDALLVSTTGNSEAEQAVLRYAVR